MMRGLAPSGIMHPAIAVALLIAFRLFSDSVLSRDLYAG